MIEPATVAAARGERLMPLTHAFVLSVLVAAAGETPALIVQAPDSPVRLDRAVVLTVANDPPVLLYSATNLTDEELDQFTVMAFVFEADGTLKARQVAPARRTLEARGTKFSTLVLDGSDVKTTDIVVVGVNQAQRASSTAWWRAELQGAAEKLVPLKKPTK
jgi:hypothetical protein